MRTLSWILGLTVATTLSTPRAEACSPNSCASVQPAPSDGATVPASTPAIAITARVGTESEIALIDESGRPVEASVMVENDPIAFLVSPMAPLEAGRRYSIGFTAPMCPAHAGFTVGPAVPLPTSAGRLRVDHTGRREIAVASSRGGCTEPMEADTVVLDWTPPPEITPYASTMRLETVIDGDRWAITPYGHPPVVEKGGIVPTSFRTPIQIFSRCDRDPDLPNDSGLAPGTHHGELRVQVAGMNPALPAIPFDVTLDCGGCAMGGAGSTPAWGVCLVALWLVVRARRRRYLASEG